MSLGLHNLLMALCMRILKFCNKMARIIHGDKFLPSVNVEHQGGMQKQYCANSDTSKVSHMQGEL